MAFQTILILGLALTIIISPQIGFAEEAAEAGAGETREDSKPTSGAPVRAFEDERSGRESGVPGGSSKKSSSPIHLGGILSSEKFVEGMIERLDTDGDDKLGKDEIPERALARFGEQDENKDGFVTKEEMLADLNARKAASEKETEKNRSTIQWTQSDRNKDGSLSEDEVSADHWAFLESADKDKDGKVTREEAKTHHESKYPQRRAKPSGPGSELREKMMELSEDQRQELFKLLRKKFQSDPGLSVEERRELVRKALEEFSGPR